MRQNTIAFWVLPLILILLSCACLPGCTQQPANLIQFYPLGVSLEAAAVLIKEIDAYNVFSNKEFSVAASVYEYNSVLGLVIAIKNNSKKDIGPRDYAVTMEDGRDRKLVKMLTRDDLVAVRNRLSGVSNRAFQDQLIDLTITNVMKVANVPTKDQMIALLNQAIENYFEFRPIYARETRQGFICFLPHFNLEYPLTLTLKVKKREINVRFMPVDKQLSEAGGQHEYLGFLQPETE